MPVLNRLGSGRRSAHGMTEWSWEPKRIGVASGGRSPRSLRGRTPDLTGCAHYPHAEWRSQRQGPGLFEGVLAAALLAIPPAVAVFETDGRAVWSNRSLRQLLGGSPDTPVALDAVFAASLDEDAPLKRALRQAAAGTASRIDKVSMSAPSGTVEREGWVGPVPVGDGSPDMAVLVSRPRRSGCIRFSRTPSTSSR